MFDFKLSMKINARQNIYRTFKGKENRERENTSKKSFVDLLQTIDFDKEQSSKMSLLDAIKLKEVEEKAKDFSQNSTLNIDG